MLKSASSPRAAASSSSVFNVAGAESTRFDTAVCTKAVVASCVVFVAAAAVGAVGVPVNAGEAKGAYVEDALEVVRYPPLAWSPQL